MNQIYSHAALFVLPSYHEGLPIALLEALSYGLPVLVSDIPANKEVGLPMERYFRCGDVEGLRERIQTLLGRGMSEAARNIVREQIKAKYNWDKIAEETLQVYEKVLTKRLRLWGGAKGSAKYLRNGSQSGSLPLRG